MSLRTFLLRLALVALFAGGLPACEGLLGGRTKTAAGELYESGDAKYDAYFKKVHEEQVAASAWADESKAAKKPLTAALDLPLTASGSTVLSAAKKKKDEAAVKSAAAETAGAELAFAAKQRESARRLEELAAVGAELKKQAVEERRNMAADKADKEKVEKKEEVKREISAAVDVVSRLLDAAKSGADDAANLAKGLEKELGVVASARQPKKDESEAAGGAAASKPAARPAPKPAAKKPAAKATPPSEDKPAPKPAAKPKPDDEVFNP